MFLQLCCCPLSRPVTPAARCFVRFGSRTPPDLGRALRSSPVHSRPVQSSQSPRPTSRVGWRAPLLSSRALLPRHHTQAPRPSPPPDWERAGRRGARHPPPLSRTTCRRVDRTSRRHNSHRLPSRAWDSLRTKKDHLGTNTLSCVASRDPHRGGLGGCPNLLYSAYLCFVFMVFHCHCVRAHRVCSCSCEK